VELQEDHIFLVPLPSQIHNFAYRYVLLQRIILT